MEIGEKIRNIRKKRKLSQIDLAKSAGISNTYLSDLELGRTTPSIKTLQNLAKSLGVDITLFLK